jgi:hypothetical protein
MSNTITGKLVALLAMGASVVTILGYFKIDSIWNSVRPPEIQQFTATPLIINSGEPVLLRWTAKYARNCQIDWASPHGEKNSVPVDASGEFREKMGFFTGNVDFHLICWSGGRTDQGDVSVYVQAPSEASEDSSPRYTSVIQIKRALDCDAVFTEGQRQLNLARTFSGLRTRFEKTVEDIDGHTRYALLTKSAEYSYGLLQTGAMGPMGLSFSKEPQIYFRTPFTFTEIKKGQKAFVDCRVADYCKSSLLGGSALTFDDCYLPRR